MSVGQRGVRYSVGDSGYWEKFDKKGEINFRHYSRDLTIKNEWNNSA